MTNISVVENKISEVKKYLQEVDGFRSLTREEILGDSRTKGALERYLYLSVQSTIHLAEAFVSYMEFRKPSTLRSSFKILGEQGIIEEELAEKLSNMVSFRNVLAHDYVSLDYDIVFNVLEEDIDDIEEFINLISQKL